MARKKRKRSNTPRVKRMNRNGRLQSAVKWLQTYNGASVIRGYRKYYGVQVEVAIQELRLLGVSLSDDAVRSALASAEALARQKKARKEKREQRHLEKLRDSCSDGTFAFIAGYTSGGMPYGITWEEWEQMQDWDSLLELCPPKHLRDEKLPESEQPFIEVRDAEEVPFDLECFMKYATLFLC